MPSPPRILDPDGYYHVISRGNNRQRLFMRSDDYAHFLSLLKSLREKYQIDIFHYVLMPNHIHLLVRPNGDCLPRFMHELKLSYAKRYGKQYDFVGHVWQGRYKALHIMTEAYLSACGEYIQNNPVRAGLCSRPQDWPYSSALKKEAAT